MGGNKRMRVMIVVLCILALVMVYKNFGGGGGGSDDATVVTTTSVPALLAPSDTPSATNATNDDAPSGDDDLDAPVTRNPFKPAG